MPQSKTAWLVLGVGILVACSRDQQPPARSGSDSAPAPTMRILAPRAGDRWMEGSTQVIRWTTTIPRINLGAAVGGKDKGHLLLDAPSTPDSLLWNIPLGFVTGFGPDSATNVRIRLESAADPTAFVVSGPFTIVGRAGSLTPGRRHDE